MSLLPQKRTCHCAGIWGKDLGQEGHRDDTVQLLPAKGQGTVKGSLGNKMVGLSRAAALHLSVPPGARACAREVAPPATYPSHWVTGSQLIASAAWKCPILKPLDELSTLPTSGTPSLHQWVPDPGSLHCRFLLLWRQELGCHGSSCAPYTRPLGALIR